MVPGDSERSQESGVIRERAVRLFEFLRALAELRTETIRSVDRYEEALWFDDIPKDAGTYCAAWAAAGDEHADGWLEIKKPKLRSHPVVPEALVPWLDPVEVADSSRDFPTLRDRIIISSPTDSHETTAESSVAERSLADVPQIKELWEDYVQTQWWPWAEEDRKLQAVQRVYGHLFLIYKRQQQLGEAYEAVLGLGYLTWRTPKATEVRRHLMTAQTSLMFDASRGILTVGPGGEGAKLALEQDMLEVNERPPAAELAVIEQKVASIGDAVWPPEQLCDALRSWVHAASARGQFDSALTRQQRCDSDPRVNLAPALILRKRPERSLLRVFKEIVEQLRKGGEVPDGVKRLVMVMDDARGLPNRDPSAQLAQIEEMYFPLPANEEQTKIVSELAHRQGVLVQGPPGTGKSHTIANLICHLLASGGRVLVTSHTTRALRVLREKIPAQVAPLCVILLGDDITAMQALEDSVRGITDEYHRWDAGRNARQIRESESQLEKARQNESLALSELRAIREAETFQHRLPFGDYAGTAQVIAARIRDEEPQLSWLAEYATGDGDSPLSDSEAAALLRLFRSIDEAGEDELGRTIVPLEQLPDPDTFDTFIEDEKRALSACEASPGARQHPAYPVALRMSREQRESVVAEVSALRTASANLEGYARPWVREAAAQVVHGQRRVWEELLNLTARELAPIKESLNTVSRLQISGLDQRERAIVMVHASALLKHLEAGRRLGIGPFRPKVVKQGFYLVRDVRVNGRAADHPQALRELLEWLRTCECVAALEAHWAGREATPIGSLELRAATFRDLHELLARVLNLGKHVDAIKTMLLSLGQLPEPRWEVTQDIDDLLQAMTAARLEEQLQEIRARADDVTILATSTARREDCHFLVGNLGAAVQSRNKDAYRETYDALRAVIKTRELLRHRDALALRLEAVAPSLASELKSRREDAVWDARMSDFHRAWNWARANRWLQRLSDPNAPSMAAVKLRRWRRKVLSCREELASAKAWRFCLTRLTEEERQHLEAWQVEMKLVGKGTGKYAPVHRRNARRHMEQCRSAIPAWIMPIYKVAETVRPGTDAFDVVIVDEASQSGPEALFLSYLAKKIIVVGDDQQISPDFVGISREDVDQLRQQYIADLPHNDTIGVDTSFFTQGQIRYGGRIRLREHFRCMPEIIQFSNNLCYSSEPLIPLRQYGTDRLQPAVIAHHVQGGYQQGISPRIINPMEAKAIAAKIAELCQDPRYDGRTMGVISLLGEDQARHIEALLLNKIGPEEMERRRLVCGDAYAFQGDERHVMFLSMVSAPTEGHRIGVLATEAAKRRFNVAASRAQDQMWLFHSATLNDLGQTCVRRRLLQYCMNPHVEPFALPGLNLEQIRGLATFANRDRTQLPEPFGSWFELDVFLKIGDRGYRVLPQVEIASYRIDLVVEGVQGRLAVECDGDAWHGAEQYELDMGRQRDLERCGWTFWRVRGCAFYRDPDGALADLWRTLDLHGIYPADGSMLAPIANGVKLEPPLPQLVQNSIQLGTSQHPEQIQGPSQHDDEGDATGLEEDIATTIEGGQVSLSGLATADGSTEAEPAEEIAEPDVAPVYRKPYRSWRARPLLDPRTATSRDTLSGLIKIVEAEGPMLCHRAYRLYARAAGIAKVGRNLRSILNRAIHTAVRQGLLEERNEYETRDQINQVVRLAGTPTVDLREPGDRTLFEIPPSEIGALMQLLATENPTLKGDTFLRAVAQQYGIVRMSAKMRKLLEQIRTRYLTPT